jgi:hypothetical protein
VWPSGDDGKREGPNCVGLYMQGTVILRLQIRNYISYHKVALLSSLTHQMMVLPSNGGSARESQDDSTTDIEMCTTRRQILRRPCRNTVQNSLVIYESYSAYSG